MHVASCSHRLRRLQGARHRRRRSGATTPTCTTRAPRPRSLLGHNRYSTNTWPTFKRVQPFGVLGHNGEINTDRPPAPGGADARRAAARPTARTRRTSAASVESLIHREGLTLVEALELALPPIVERDQGHARGAARLLHVPAPGLRPVRAGPGGAGLPPRRRVRLLGRRARPAAAVAARDRRRATSSPPSRAWWPWPTPSAEPKPLAPGEKVLVALDRAARHEHGCSTTTRAAAAVRASAGASARAATADDGVRRRRHPDRRPARRAPRSPATRAPARPSR